MEKTAFCNRRARYAFWLNSRTILAMRLTVLLLTAAFLNVNANGVAQTVSIAGKNLSLEQVFTAIEKQTGYFVVYKADLIRNTKNVSLNVRNMQLNQLLGLVLRDEPLDFAIDKKTIFIVQKQRKEPIVKPTVNQSVALIEAPPFERVTGTILSGESKEPLAGASVVIRKKSISTQTDAKGQFVIDVSKGDILTISYVGFQTMEFEVKEQYRNM
ncbi:MAG: SusC/RagA family TonB-linked outer membrane protein, partial [Chitinophagaceae bacterium]